MVCALLLMASATVRGTDTWVSGATGNWSDGTKWGNAVPPTVAETALINTGNVTLDTSQQVGQLLMGNTVTSVGVLNITNGSNLTVSKASAELFGVVKLTGGASSTVNHSAGTVSVFQPGYTGLGETRLVTASTTTGTAI